MMYIENGKCIQCGRPVKQTIVCPDYNLQFINVPVEVKPAFCSQNCYDKMMPGRIKRHIPDEPSHRNWERIRYLEERMEDVRYKLNKQARDEGYSSSEIDEAYNDAIRPWLREIDQLKNDKSAPEYKIISELNAFNELREEYADGIRAKAQAELEKNPPAVLPDIPEEAWSRHCLLIATTGAGKSNTIRYRLAQLLPAVAQSNHSIILMEPKGSLINEVLHMASLYAMRDKVTILDPIDTKASVNIFECGSKSEYEIQQTIDRVARVLNTVTKELTQFQKDTLLFSLRALFCIDQPPTMRLLMTILRKGIKGLPVRNLPYVVEEFFNDDPKARESSSQQVVSRLNSLLANPIMEALFSADRSTFNMLDEINQGRLIVINASNSDNVYARFWIEQVASCIAPRLKIPVNQRIPTTFILDEAQMFVSEDLHFAGILDRARESRIAMMLALHTLSQIKSSEVKGSLLTNTAIKLASRTTEDIYSLCRSMNCETSFISDLPAFEFAYAGMGMTKAIRVKFPLVEFTEKMTESQYQKMRDANRKRYSYVRDQPPQAQEMVRTEEAPATVIAPIVAETPKAVTVTTTSAL